MTSAELRSSRGMGVDAAFDALNARVLRTTMLLSYLGMPGVSVPADVTTRRGVGILISAPEGGDDQALQAADLVDGALRATP